MSAYLLTQDALTIVEDSGTPRVFNRRDYSEETFSKALEAVNDSDFDTALRILSPRDTLEEFFDHTDEVAISNGAIYYKGQAIDDYAARRALEFAREGLPYRPVLKFIERVRQNPSYRAVQELYQFLEHGGLPITPDGRFMAYKKVRRNADGNLVDIHSGQFDNNPGTTVEIPRNQVDEDPTNVCSRGLHVCSYEYLPSFGNDSWDTAVSAEVDPADVVAVPHDYRHSKMRVCRYRVIAELPDYEEDYLRTSYWDDEDDDPLEVDEDDDELGGFDSESIPVDDPLDWVPNNGSEPCVRFVDVVLRNGSILRERVSDRLDWDIIDDHSENIVYWRPAR